MFKVYEVHEGDNSYEVYSVHVEDGITMFLMWDKDDREWFWDKADNYAPAYM